MEYVIALDQGSSSSRALAIDSRGRVAAMAQVPVRTRYPGPGCVEHDALDLARTQERALDSVLRRLPKKASVAALGITAQRSTIVLWDSKTGKPCAPALSWQDGRAAPLVAPLLDRQRFVHERTGLYLTPYYSAPKIRWLLENAPQVRDLAGSGRLRVGPISTYLLWRLTGGEVFAVDPTMAQRMLLLDIRSMAWDEELIALFGIPRESLPAILPTVGRWGTVVRGGRRIPVYACVGDQQSAAVGQGAQDTGEGVLNYGTGAFFLLHTGERAHRVPGLLTSVALTREAALRPFSSRAPCTRRHHLRLAPEISACSRIPSRPTRSAARRRPPQTSEALPRVIPRSPQDASGRSRPSAGWAPRAGTIRPRPCSLASLRAPGARTSCGP